MDAQNFAYWLQGFVELNGGQMPSEEQWRSICEHLGLVFNKVTKPVVVDNKTRITPEPVPKPAALPAEPLGVPIKPEIAKQAGDILKEMERIRKEKEDRQRAIDPFKTYPPFIPYAPRWPSDLVPMPNHPYKFPDVIC